MLRAVALAARLELHDRSAGARRDPHAPPRDREELAAAAARGVLQDPARRIRRRRRSACWPRSGCSSRFQRELHRGAADPLWRSLAELDAYRRRFESTPGHADQRRSCSAACSSRSGFAASAFGPSRKETASARARLGALPLARRDVERLRQILGLQRRLRDVTASPRAQRALAHRSLFPETLTWFEIHGDDPGAVEKWKTVLAQGPVEGEDLPVESRRARAPTAASATTAAPGRACSVLIVRKCEFRI